MNIIYYFIYILLVVIYFILIYYVKQNIKTINKLHIIKKYQVIHLLLLFYHYYMKLSSFSYLYNTYPLDLLFLYVLLIFVQSFLYLCPICIHIYQLTHNLHINCHETNYPLKVLFNSLVNDQSSFLNIFDLKVLNF